MGFCTKIIYSRYREYFKRNKKDVIFTPPIRFKFRNGSLVNTLEYFTKTSENNKVFFGTTPYCEPHDMRDYKYAFTGSWLNVSSVSSRIVFITIFFTALLLYAHYTSALVAQLTVTTDIPTRFTTLQGFLEDGTRELCIEDGTSITDLLQASCYHS